MKLKNENLIKDFEGFELTAYADIKGVPTVGWGHTGPEVIVGKTYTQEQCEKWFDEDNDEAENAVNSLVKVELNQNQFDALVSIVYNIGVGNFKSSTFLKRLNNNDYDGCAEAMKWFNKARVDGKLVVVKGLVNRRAKEAEVFLTPISDDKYDVVEEVPASADAHELPSLIKSSEVRAGAIGAVASAGGFIGQLTPYAQVALMVGLSVALIVGVFVVYNRYIARQKGER